MNDEIKRLFKMMSENCEIIKWVLKNVLSDLEESSLENVGWIYEWCKKNGLRVGEFLKLIRILIETFIDDRIIKEIKKN